MPISRKDKKIIFEYLKNSQGGLHFSKILEPEPEPVNKGGCTMLESVRKVESSDDDIFEFWEELKRNGLIRPVDRLNPERFVLTPKGKQVADAEDYDLTLPSLEIGVLIKDSGLSSIVGELFAAQRYEDAVFKAFKYLEERVRAKAGLSATDFGTSMIVDALHHERGALKIPACKATAEEEGVFLLFKGAIQLFKNPPSHRTVGWNDPVRTAQVLLFADYLLGMLDQATTR